MVDLGFSGKTDKSELTSHLLRASVRWIAKYVERRVAKQMVLGFTVASIITFRKRGAPHRS
jgi:hypothetical protein